MSVLEDALENEKEMKRFEQELRDNYIKRSFISMSSGSSFDPDQHRNIRMSSSNSSSSDDFNHLASKSKFFVNTESKEIEASDSNNIDFLLNQSPKSSDYLPPNIYRPAYLYKKYKYADLFRVEIVNVFLFTFLFSTIQLLCILLNIPLYISYFLRIIAHSCVLLFVTLLFNSEEAYRSINVTMETSMVHTVLFNYTILDIMVYTSIQVCITFFTNLFIFGILYDPIQKIPTQLLMENMIYYSNHSSFSNISIPMYSSIIYYSLELLFMITIQTQVIDRITSIEYKKIIYMKTGLLLLFNLAFTGISSFITSVSYTFGTACALVVIKLDMTPLSYQSYMIVILLCITLCITPITAWFGYYHLRYFYNKYIEI